MRGWYRHLNGGWRLSERPIESEQYIRDEDGNLLRDRGLISGRWERYVSTLLNAISATVDRTIIEKISQRPIALSLGNPPSPSETMEALRAMSNGKETDPDGIPAEIPKLGLNEEASDILYNFHDIVAAVWRIGEVPQEWKDVTIKVLHEQQDRIQCSNYRGISLVAHTAKVLLKIVANRLGNVCEETDVFPEEQCGFMRKRSTIDMMFVVRRLQELGRASNIPINMCFIDLQEAYDSVDRTLLWEVPSRFGVPLRMVTIIRV
ncbi:unnamed protein product, partial [Sphacelaria rigidula]